MMDPECRRENGRQLQVLSEVQGAMNSFDVAITSFLNQFAHKSVRFDELVVVVSGSSLLKSGSLVAFMWWTWFANEDARRKREALLAAMAAIVPALAASQCISGDCVSAQAPDGTPIALSTALRNVCRSSSKGVH